MTQPQSDYLSLLGHEVHVTRWGDAANPALVMWHGLTRTGRDFDELASAFASRFFVLCPDTIGRGFSSWSDNSLEHYQPAYYEKLALAMLDTYQIPDCDWLGTSMGGLIGIHLASGEGRSRIRRLILNDIGPEIPQEALTRILTYAGELPEFRTLLEAEGWFRTIYTPFGAAPDGFWRRMAETSQRRKDNGAFTLHYDPEIITALRANPGQLELWDRYQAITLPTHLLRGAASDLVSESLAQRMSETGPKPRITNFTNCGHAPALANQADIAMVQTIMDALA